MNHYSENMFAEMGIGPRWTLRLNTQIDSTFPLSEVPDTAPVQKNAADMLPQAVLKPALSAPINTMFCQTCGYPQSLLNAPRSHIKCLFIQGDLIAGEGRLSPALNGAASALLNNVMQALHWRRGVDAYLASIVKMNSALQVAVGDNNGEFIACLDCLKKQIKILQPALIISLGSAAAVSLLDLEKQLQDNDLRGHIRHYDNIPVVTTYDMMHVLMHRKDKGALWADLCLALSSTPAH